MIQDMEILQNIKQLPKYEKEMFKVWKANGLISVGAMNKLFETDADREGLARWKANYDLKHGEGACDRYMAECCRRGTLLHENIEAKLYNQPLPHSDEVLGKYAKMQKNYFSKFLNKVDPIYLEKIMCNEELRLTGIVDCIGYYDGVLSIIDFKFSSKPKDEAYITDYRRQVAAYALIVYKETGVLIKQCVIAVGNEKDNECQVFKYPTSPMVKGLVVNLKNINYFAK